ncbi:probable G-protein coupled receptor 139 [Mytilus edulis]|uniref:GPR139 n=1 Tax=Mytilus edulis TaxID=6550 RepID=A0A8S3VDY2_MYTED|nr:GPR139 [Mytilus edulis]
MNRTSPFKMNISTTPLAMVKTDNTADMVSVAKEMHWYSSVVFGTFFVVVGLIGNMLSMIIWNRKSLRSSTGTYLIAQAAADMSVLIFFFFTDSLAMMDPDIKRDDSYGMFYSYVGYPIFYLAIIISIWMTVGVTVDRYIQVCWISYSKSMCNHKRSLSGIGIISLLCFIINIPHFFTYEPVHERNATDDSFVMTEFGKGHGSQSYEFWVHCMFLVLVPWVTIFCLNLMIIKQVLKTGAKMSDRKSVYAKEKTKRAENQLTTLLLTVTFTFLVLIALQCITQCFFMMKPKTVNFELVNEAFAVAKLGVIINSSINFFLYCLSGRRFRKELFSIMGWQFNFGDHSDLSSDRSGSGSETKTSAM